MMIMQIYFLGQKMFVWHNLYLIEKIKKIVKFITILRRNHTLI